MGGSIKSSLWSSLEAGFGEASHYIFVFVLMSAPCPQFSSQGMRGCVLPQQHNGRLLVLIFSQCVFTPLCCPQYWICPGCLNGLCSLAAVHLPLQEAYCKQRQKKLQNIRDLEIYTYTVFIQYPSDKSITATLAVNLLSIFFLFGET